MKTSSVRGARGGVSAGLVLLLFAVLVHPTCHQALFTAPPGATLQVFANPEFIPAHGGVSVITAVVIEASGTPVADGTVVQFFTSLGRIDEQGRTNDGLARVNLVADSRSGEAVVQAFSGGGEETSPTSSTTGSSTTTTSPTTSSTTLATAQGLAPLLLAAAASPATASDSVTVQIGSALPAKVVVTAFPQRLTDRRASLITANVFDDKGNPVAHVPIIFKVEAAAGDILTELMDSQGSPTFTDNNGQAQDVLRTRYDPSHDPRAVVVRATAPRGEEGTITVFIN